MASISAMMAVIIIMAVTAVLKYFICNLISKYIAACYSTQLKHILADQAFAGMH